MFTLLGLLGLAMAGTAFVSLGTDDEPDQDVVTQDTEETETADFFDVLSSGPIAGGAGDLTDPTGIAETLFDTADAALRATTDDSHVIWGSAAADLIDGQDGDDYINGQGGDDTMTGGAGADQIHGGDGNDAAQGDDGADKVYGDLGADVLAGGAGADVLHGGDGDDTIDGGYDDDELLGGYGDDTLIGGAGRDMIQGSDGNDVVDGATGEDDAERDYLNGSEGNDRLIGNDGDVMSGGTGDDIFQVKNGAVSIMDYEANEILVLHHDGDAPTLTTSTSDTGVTVLANGNPVAVIFGVTTFDLGAVHLVAS